MRYVENIVKLFDKVAAEAVENYQMTVSGERVDVAESETTTEDTTVSDSEMVDEEGALLAYKSGGSYSLNAKIREGAELNEQEQSIVDNLDKALEKLPTYQGKVYRNIQFDGFGDAEARDAFVAGHIIGKVVKYDAYTSTSERTDGYPLEGKYIVHLEIEGINGRNLEGHGSDAESEILFARGSRFFTENIKYDQDGTPTIYLTEVNTNAKGKNDTGRTDTSVQGDHSGEQGSRTYSAEDTSMQSVQEPKTEDMHMQSAPGVDTGRSVGRKTDLQGVQGEVDSGTDESLQNEYKKKYSWLLQHAPRQYAIKYGGEVFLSDGSIGIKASADMVDIARSKYTEKLVEVDMPDHVVKNLDDAKTLITEAPLEGKLKGKPVYVFEIDGKPNVFSKKFISLIDGNLFYFGGAGNTAIIKAVDTVGNLEGFVLPVHISSKNDITDIKPSKLKSFSKKMQGEIAKKSDIVQEQSRNYNAERGNINGREEQADGDLDNSRDGWERGAPQYAQKELLQGSRDISVVDRDSSESRGIEGRSGKVLRNTDSEGVRIEVSTLDKLSSTSVVDANGHPLAVYHSTNADFSAFSKGDIGFHFGNKLQSKKRAEDKKFGLTKTESENLRRYVMSAYFMNAKMYSGNITESDIQYIDELQSALNKFPTFSGRTYRNLKFKDIQNYNAFLKENSLNETVTLKAFTSTSKDPNGYKCFGNGVVHMVFDGVSGRDIADTYGVPRQQEVLYLPGMKYTVTNVTVANDGNPLIYIKELSSNEKVQDNDGDFRGRESGLGTITQSNIPIPRGEGYDNRGIHGNGRGTEDNGEKSRSTVNVKETSSNERVHEGRNDGHTGRDQTGESGSRTYTAKENKVQRVSKQNTVHSAMQPLPERNTQGNTERKTDLQGVQGEVDSGTDEVQYQSRDYLSDDYSTEGVHWGVEDGIISKSDARIVWEAIANIEKRGYNSYVKTVSGNYIIESDNALMVLDSDYQNPIVREIYTFKDNESYAKEALINAIARENKREIQESKQTVEVVFGEGYVVEYAFEDSFAYGRQNGRGEGIYSRGNTEQAHSREWHFDTEQEQQRTNTLTDRNIQFDGFGDAEARDAFVAGHIIGLPIKYDSYTSASTRTDGYPLEGKYVVHLEIDSKNGRNTEGHGSNAESEVLFPRGTGFVVNNITYDENGTPTLYLTEVNSNAENGNDTGRADTSVQGDHSGEQGSRTLDEAENPQVREMSEIYTAHDQVQSVSERNPGQDLGRKAGVQGVQGEVDSGTDEVQYQSRDYLSDDYSTEGVHWMYEIDGIENSDVKFVWDVITNINQRGYKGYTKTVNGEYIADNENKIYFINADFHDPFVSKVIILADSYETNMFEAKEWIRNAKGDETRHREALRIIEIFKGEEYAHEYSNQDYSTYGRQNGRGEGNYSRGNTEQAHSREWHFDTEQEQQRTETLTDREVLELAANEVNVDELTLGEAEALKIFKKRIDTLRNYQEKRAELGRLYKEQQFGEHVDRDKAYASYVLIGTAESSDNFYVVRSIVNRYSNELFSMDVLYSMNAKKGTAALDAPGASPPVTVPLSV